MWPNCGVAGQAETGSQWAPRTPKSGSAVTAVGAGARERRPRAVRLRRSQGPRGRGLSELPGAAGPGQPRRASRGPEGIFGSPGGRTGSGGSYRRVGEDPGGELLLRLLEAGTCAAVQGVDLQAGGEVVTVRCRRRAWLPPASRTLPPGPISRDAPPPTPAPAPGPMISPSPPHLEHSVSPASASQSPARRCR